MSNLDKLLEKLLEVSDWPTSITGWDRLPKPDLYKNLQELKKVISQSSIAEIITSLDNIESKLVDFWVFRGQCPNCEYPLNFHPEIGFADYGELVGLNPFQGQQIAKCPDCGWEE